MKSEPTIPEFLRTDRRESSDRRTSAQRKAQPIFSGVLLYFPDALAAVAELSKAGNDKHNPGQPLHWSREKSNDHADCVARHLIDVGPDWTEVDHEDGLLHAQKVAWRALAMLQIAIERRRGQEAQKSPWPSPRYSGVEYTAAAAPVPTPAVEDGWIVWSGGEQPVPDGTNVEARLREGSTGKGLAEAWRWEWDGCDVADIVAYRVVKA